MIRHTGTILCFIAMLSAGMAFAGNLHDSTGQSSESTRSSSPAAYVYVTSNYSGSTNRILGFSADSAGKLTPVSGSPFAANIYSMAVNGKYLFGADTNQVYVYTFSMETDGALKHVATTNAQTHNSSGCGGLSPPLLDHTGATLYEGVQIGGSGPGYDCAESQWQSYEINRATGTLTYLGSNGDLFLFFPNLLSFVGNNVYAFGAYCGFAQGTYLPNIYGFERKSNGLLVQSTEPPIQPPNPKTGDFYCPASTAAADPTDHLAVVLQAINQQSYELDGPPQIATYTADKAGNLTSTSTYQNMPAVKVGTVSDSKMSPSGKLLAIGGDSGLQMFHYDGANPVKSYTGLLTNDGIDQFFWDNENHLYAISGSAGKLFVFTVTPASVTQAPGSPYTITKPQGIIVQPRTPKP